MNSEGFRGRAGSWSWEQQSAPKPSVPFLLCREWGHQTIGALRMERSVMAGCGVWSERHSHSSLRWWHCSASPVSSSHIAATRWTLSPSRYRPSWGTSEGLLPSKHPPHIHEGSSASGPRGSVSLSLSFSSVARRALRTKEQFISRAKSFSIGFILYSHSFHLSAGFFRLKTFVKLCSF